MAELIEPENLGVSKGPGYDWVVTYQNEGEEPGDISVFGKIKIEDAIKEARRSLSFNFFDSKDFVEPVILAARRVDAEKKEES